MHDAPSLLARLDVAQQTGSFPAPLVEDLRTALIQQLPCAERRAIQADLIREAAAMIEGTPWQRAKRLAVIIGQWTGRPCSDPIRQALYRASQTGLKLPATARQLYSIITAGD